MVPTIYLDTDLNLDAPFFVKYSCYKIFLNEPKYIGESILGICMECSEEGLVLWEFNFDENNEDKFSLGKSILINWSLIDVALLLKVKVKVVNSKKIEA